MFALIGLMMSLTMRMMWMMFHLCVMMVRLMVPLTVAVCRMTWWVLLVSFKGLAFVVAASATFIAALAQSRNRSPQP